MLFADAALARRVETAEAAVARECSGRESDSLAIGGGIAVFAGAGSPLTQAVGLGMNGPVGESEIAKLEEFFRTRGAAVKVEISPLADPQLIQTLGDRGYRVTEFNNVMVRRLDGFGAPEAPRVRRIRPAENELWCHTVAAGFFDQSELSEDEMDIGRAIAAMPGVSCYLAWEFGARAAGAAMSVRSGLACLFADSTVKAYRGRGLHRELIVARLSDALSQGCDAATASTLPGSASQRNYERLGFEVAYTRTTLVA